MRRFSFGLVMATLPAFALFLLLAGCGGDKDKGPSGGSGGGDGPAPAESPKPKDSPLGMKFVPLPKGTFYMGWNGKKDSAKKTEIKENFEIAIHTVTQGQWQEVMGKNPSFFSRDGKGKGYVK